MNWRSPRLGLAFLLSFSGCSCEWHVGTSTHSSSSGGEQVIVFQDPDGEAQARAERERRERERAAEQAHRPRYAGDSSKTIHVGGTPPSSGQATVPAGSVPPAPASAPGPASIGAAPTPSSPSVAPPPSGAPPAGPAPVAQPAPAPAPAPAAPAPPPGDTYVPARHPGTRPPSSGGAVTAGDPAQDQNKSPAQPVAPPRSR